MRSVIQGRIILLGGGYISMNGVTIKVMYLFIADIYHLLQVWEQVVPAIHLSLPSREKRFQPISDKICGGSATHPHIITLLDSNIVE
ncbi:MULTISPECIES: hypothetical protein [Pseudoalteromonas]|uniref:hypothetical protein n=1 Tax=Pseudoalteromonas TaxID=53246 RepID=UPI000492C58D|nr:MULTISPECIES: hypothetical protein [Pseudoalteromonas]MBR8843864.1 hypothetical protein [Pseudoalteromonas sp. JC3]MCF2829596.1 hypothetical protein [Pseudoalteromonas sp. OF5H-5]MCF2830852.1 hypothetical protein [Pseudoalteromonas sp. DL2-H6]MCF2927320.1 hypothetical protein [Pseudoalteromonas sp. DL2-H1]MCF7512186.1 hypothetical protein [Pseudoalteromonas sp. L7]